MQFKYAILMNVPVEALKNLKLFSFIDEWYGIPYRFGGSSKAGIDCSAFSGNLMTTVFGVGLPRMAKDQYNACERVQKNELEEGDLVFFHTTRKGISHVGVYLGNNKFVHASLNYGVTISDLTDPYYSHSFRGGGRAARQNTTASGN
jgi:lipoprotein Spr